MLLALSQDTTKLNFTVPSLLKPSTANTFIVLYKQLLRKAKLMEKVQDISNRLKTASPKEKQFLIQCLNKYDKVWVELLKAATRNFRLSAGSKLWSPLLA